MITGAEVRYPHFDVDLEADAVYIYLNDISDFDVARTESITDSINADYDTDGNVIGIEFLTCKIDFGEQFPLNPKESA
jgi:uncharacterized protein YuzE